MTAPVPYRSLAIRRALQTHTALWHEHVSSETTSVQYGVLYFLNEHGELGQRELMDLTQLDKSSLAELLRRMEGQGSIETRRDGDDKRRKTVTVTRQGRELFEHLRPAALRVNEMLTGNLSDTETQSLDRLLAKIVNDGERAAS
ncbi:MAG: winged helix-turn-helix transcriptional regulator [Salinibacterium sp.]|nr:MarR family winged helix-turn-helix transcriptional regulator [Salinibacterium sp.]MBF0671895.1 winged helix-turn-helix transcriptional regulator [Salinibacterium sp.]